MGKPFLKVVGTQGFAIKAPWGLITLPYWADETTVDIMIEQLGHSWSFGKEVGAFLTINLLDAEPASEALH